MTTWWPWTDRTQEAPVSPAPARPAPDRCADVAAFLVTQAGMDAMTWQTRCLEADAILREGMRRYGKWVPVDVLLDAHNALRPPQAVPPLRPAVPVIPGRRDG